VQRAPAYAPSVSLNSCAFGAPFRLPVNLTAAGILSLPWARLPQRPSQATA